MLCTFRGRRPCRQSIELLRALASGDRSQLPDLDAEVAERAASHPPLAADLRRFGDLVLARSEPLLLDLCAIDVDGHFAVGVHLERLRGRVRTNDVVLGGALFSGDVLEGTCQVSPRLLRILCRNGAVLPVSEGIAEHAYFRASDDGTCGDLEETLACAFSLESVAAAARALQGASVTPAFDAVEDLARHAVGVPPEDAPFVHALFREGNDRTLYGAFNALTTRARMTRRLAHRERLERLAGGLIPALLREGKPRGRGVLV